MSRSRGGKSKLELDGYTLTACPACEGWPLRDDRSELLGYENHFLTCPTCLVRVCWQCRDRGHADCPPAEVPSLGVLGFRGPEPPKPVAPARAEKAGVTVILPPGPTPILLGPITTPPAPPCPVPDAEDHGTFELDL